MRLPAPGSDRSAPALSRLHWLRRRTQFVGLAGMVCCWAALQWLQELLLQSGVLYEKLTRQGELPGLHVPAHIASPFAFEVLQGSMLLLLGIALAGYSVQAFDRRRTLQFLMLAAMLGLLTLVMQPAASRWMHLLPSELERHVYAGRFDAAEAILLEMEKSAGSRHDYLRVQIALRAGDLPMVQRLAPPLLDVVQRHVYRFDTDGMFFGRAPTGPAYAADVLHAIDKAIHGKPLTEVGIQWEQREARRSRWREVLPVLGSLLATAAFALLGLRGLRLWNDMRRRVLRLETVSKP